MKSFFLLLLVASSFPVCCQSLQLHQDLRHLVDPKHTDKNFLTLYFEYFKLQDSGKAFIRPGSFLLKMEADFLGAQSNMGKFYMQVSQSFRCWTPKIFLNVQYSGGLGITEPKQYSYYIENNFSAGLAYPFRCMGGWWSAALNFKYLPYSKASYDPLLTLYWWKGLANYKVEVLGDFSAWTENRNHGDELTKDLGGKMFAFFAEPQVWYKLNKTMGVGIKGNVFYHVNTMDDRWQVYPTVAIRAKL